MSDASRWHENKKKSEKKEGKERVFVLQKLPPLEWRMVHSNGVSRLGFRCFSHIIPAFLWRDESWSRDLIAVV